MDPATISAVRPLQPIVSRNEFWEDDWVEQFLGPREDITGSEGAMWVRGCSSEVQQGVLFVTCRAAGSVKKRARGTIAIVG